MSDKGYKGIGMEGIIATWFAQSRKKSMDEFVKEAKRIREMVPEPASILEVAPGPGFLSTELAKLSHEYQVTGLDISKTFIDLARKHALQENVEVTFLLGDAADMPLDTETFDFITCQSAFKNFSNPVAAINEMYRVLKPGGKALIVDLRKDASKAGIKQHVNQELNLGVVNRQFTKLALYQLLNRAYTKADFIKMIDESSFTSYQIEKTSIGIEILLVKTGTEQN
ncbi:class I SAM-dependent methyltransferase [Seinonella peptonophila]|uniref:class I SAM-dependent methyltransferase n=1 Tax=Seinonella peptonophila TaxID=112248 RepID=UPI001FE4A079|nr:class I SAM-dependent methyltransferase [Seinonella peptonophila]